MSQTPIWQDEANALWNAVDNLVDMAVEEASSDGEWGRPDRTRRMKARQDVVDAVTELCGKMIGAHIAAWEKDVSLDPPSPPLPHPHPRDPCGRGCCCIPVTESVMSTETPSLFPCWGRHARMGHTEVIGQFFAGPGSNVTFLVPAIPADAASFRKATVARRGIAPMEGGAFFGFDELTEEQAMAALRVLQPYDHELAEALREQRRQIAQSEDAEEVAPKEVLDGYHTEDGDDERY